MSSIEVLEIERQSTHPSLSLREARALVNDLNRPQAYIYWIDFLSSIIGGHILFHLQLYASHWWPENNIWYWPLRTLIFVAAGLLYLRSAMFTHELVHLPRTGFQVFRIAWNLLCGIPFLIPSFTYYPHVDHHRRKSYGTKDDGEYLHLSHESPWRILSYMLLSVFTPAAIFLRFAVLTPISWLVPSFRNWTFRHASTMVMDPMYQRPNASRQTERIRRIQEVACFAYCMLVVFRGQILSGQWYDPFWVNGYLMAVGLVIINNLRTLGAHRWTGDGTPLSFEDQLLDSVNYPYRPWITELWGPVGTRYHAIHHLFPSIPYHNLGIAHRRLIDGLPFDSLYRKTVRLSLIAEISSLWWRAYHRDRSHKSGSKQATHT